VGDFASGFIGAADLSKAGQGDRILLFAGPEKKGGIQAIASGIGQEVKGNGGAVGVVGGIQDRVGDGWGHRVILQTG
jgi:hypothetical protein